MLSVMEEISASKSQMNIVTAGKSPEPRWLTHDQAKQALKTGLLTWDFASDENPHIVLVGIGDYMTKEAMAAVELIKKEAPEIRVRFVNIVRLQAACACKDTFHPQLPDAEKYFTVDKPVIVNFHGYPEAMKAMFADVKNPQRFSVHGYIEEGGTTTPFDMQVRNRTDRYHLAMEVFGKMAREGILDEKKAAKLQTKYEKVLKDHFTYITKNGADPVDIEQWQWDGVVPVTDVPNGLDHETVLKNARTIAFVGLSDKPERHSHKVAKYFQKKGYRIIPVNPKYKEVLGERSYKSLTEVPRDIHIDIVDIFRKPNEVIPHMQEVVERGNIRTVWLADGVNTHEAEDFAEDYGLSMVTNYCILDAYKDMQK
jgi:predicted CoA-binding protein